MDDFTNVYTHNTTRRGGARKIEKGGQAVTEVQVRRKTWPQQVHGKQTLP